MYNKNIIIITYLQKIKIKKFTHLFLYNNLFSIITNFIYPIKQNNNKNNNNNTKNTKKSSSLTIKNKRAYVIKKRPLYYNYFLLTPNEQKLYTYNIKKIK